MSGPAQLKRIAIEPLTRVEGHGKVSILLDDDNRVHQARLHIVEFRGFERFIQGRPFWELPVLVQRLCGICPVSHHLCAAKAVDGIIGAERLTPTGEKMRRLMHYGQMFQSHSLHFFHLASPDLLFGFDAPVEKRNVFGVLAEHTPIWPCRAVMMRKFGQEIIKATAGKKVHGTGAIPGGINKNLSIEERDLLLAEIEQMIEWSLGGRDRQELHLRESGADRRASGPSTRTTCRSCARTVRWTCTTATCAPSTPQGKTMIDQVDPVRLPRRHRRGSRPGPT